MQSEEVSFQSAFERGQVSAVLMSTGRSFHHRGARTYSSLERDVQV